MERTFSQLTTNRLRNKVVTFLAPFFSLVFFHFQSFFRILRQSVSFRDGRPYSSIRTID
jgi:hypothetical protein